MGSTPSQRIDLRICDLRDVTLRPGFLDNYAADGVLHDHGLNLWEMPNPTEFTYTERAGGYYNALRQIAHSASSHTFYEQLVKGPMAPKPDDYPSAQEITDGYDFDLHATPHGAIEENDLTDPEVYRLGSAICLQNMIYAPIKKAGRPFAWDFHKYDEVSEVVDAVRPNLRIYANIGYAVNAIALANEYELALRYPQILSTDAAEGTFSQFLASAHFDVENVAEFEPHAHAYSPQAAALGYLQIKEEGVVTPLVGVPLPVFMPMPLLEPHPDVMPSILQSIAYAVSTFGYGTGADMTFLIGGEAVTYERPSSRECRDTPITDCNCETCRPITNYSESTCRFFRRYLWTIVLADGMPTEKKAEIEARWGGGTINLVGNELELDPDTVHDCSWSTQAVRDFESCEEYFLEELKLAEYRAAKEAQPCGTYAVLAILGGLEFGWLYSDRPNTITFYGDPYPNAAGEIKDPPFRESRLFDDAARTRLSGIPMIAAPTSPAGVQYPGSGTFGGVHGNADCYYNEMVQEPRPCPSLVLPQATAFCGPAPKTALGEAITNEPEPVGNKYVESGAFLPRCMEEKHVRMFLRDVLTMGACLIGHYKSPLYGLNTGSPTPGPRVGSWENVRSSLALLNTWIDPYLTFTAPHQGVIIHENLADDPVSSLPPHPSDYQHALAQKLRAYLRQRQVTYATYKSAEVRNRVHARRTMGQSITVSFFPKELQELQQILTNPDPGLAMRLKAQATSFLDDNESLTGEKGAFLAFVDGATFVAMGVLEPRPLIVPVPGSVQILMIWGDPRNRCFVLLVFDIEGLRRYTQLSEQQLCETYGGLDVEFWANKMHTDIVQPAMDRLFATQDIPVEVVKLANTPECHKFESNYATDGINIFIALVNRDRKNSASCTVSIAEGLPIGDVVTDYEYEILDVEGGPITGITLDGEGTAFLYGHLKHAPWREEFGLPDLVAKANEFKNELLNLRSIGFGVSYGLALVDKILAVECSTGSAVSKQDRMLAGLVRLSKMIFLKFGQRAVNGTTATVFVDAAYVWDEQQGGVKSTPVTNADIQVLHVLNRHESQMFPDHAFTSIRSSTYGSTTIDVDEPTGVVWDFAVEDFVTNPAALFSANPPMEVHVHDPRTGAEAFAIDLGVPGPGCQALPTGKPAPCSTPEKTR